MSKRCGYVAIVGQPNVGKSTLLNRILGQKLCITSRKAQTTRHCIMGIHTMDAAQMVFLDTPGLGVAMEGKLNHTLKRRALHVLSEVDCVCLCVAGTRWSGDDEWILRQCHKAKVPLLLVINKMDLLPNRDALLPHIQSLSQQFDCQAFVPVSAKTGQGVDALLSAITPYLPESDAWYFPPDQVTDRDDRFMVTELIREQCLRRFSQEVPHQCAVEVEHMEVQNGCLHIATLIWVARDGQKTILLGQKGEHLRVMGQRVRLHCEKMFAQKVCLKIWVKVKKDWPNSLRDLRRFGYDGV